MSSRTSIGNRGEKGDFEMFPFQADIVSLLDELMRPFYKNKQIFMRELLRNSSDALDRLNNLTQGCPMLYENDKDCSGELCIYIIPDIKQQTLTVVDNGIGMTKREILSNLAGMTKSCIRSHAEAVRHSANLNDVEECSVGFLGAFLVADKVTVYTKNTNDKHYVWESLGNGDFTLKIDIKNTTKRGTHVVLHLKSDCLEYLDEMNLIRLGKKHSMYISYPVYFKIAKDRLTGIEKQIDFTLAENVIRIEKVQEYRNGFWRDSRTQRKVFYYDVVHLNTAPHLWLREPYSATTEAYADFYKALTNDYQQHRFVLHFDLEMPVKVRALFFIPQHAAENFMEQPNVKLYVQHEFCSHNFGNQLVPDFLCFLRGVIDCAEYPEEHSYTMQQIRNGVAHKMLEMLVKLQQNQQAYLSFFKEFGKYLKLGIIEQEQLREPLMNLLLFKTSLDPQKFSSLSDYVNRCRAKQPGIYCLNAQSMQRALYSPLTEQVESFRFEIIYMLEPLDEYAIPFMPSYRGMPILPCNKEELTLPTSRVNEMRYLAQKVWFRTLSAKMKEILDWRVEKVVVSRRLYCSPCCVVTRAYCMTPGMQNAVAAQALVNSCSSMMIQHNGEGLVMEINPHCKLMKALCQTKFLRKCEHEIRFYIFLLFDLALLVSGHTLAHPKIYDLRVQRLMEQKLGIKSEYDARSFSELTMAMEAKPENSE